MALPKMDDKQRATALKKAAEARTKRAGVIDKLKDGKLKVSKVIEKAKTDEVIGKMRLEGIIKTQKGYGKARTAQVMKELGIPENRRLRGIGSRQAEALKELFG